MTTGHGVSLWSMGPFVSSALMVVVLSLFFLQTVEGPQLRSATTLGHSGATVRVVAIPATEHDESELLTAAFVDFAAAYDASIAFSRGNASGLVTLLDERGLFHSGEQTLAADLAAPGSGMTAIVSDALGREAVDRGQAVPDGVTVTSTFTSDVEFDGQYPTYLFNVDAIPFSTGVYLFATANPVRVEPAFTDDAVRIFASHGMDVVDVMPMRGASVLAWFQDSLASPFGVVILLFAGVVVLALLLVLMLHARIQRERTIIEGALGVTKSGLRRLVMQRLLVQVGPGIGLGGMIALIVLLRSEALAMAEMPARLTALATALAITLVTATLMSWGVGWREARKVAHVVPC